MAGIGNRYWKAAEIPAKSALLHNGLRVIAHRDAKVPLAAVFVAYHAGSGLERRSKTGLAHLVEHLMFCGSEHSPESYFLALERAGASSINAHVREDYTGYFATVPAGALDLALWMESERMAWTVGALEPRKLEAQREVVRNELIQRGSEPYGAAARLLAERSHREGHPYSHPLNGLVEDLDNLSLEDVQGWFATYHGAGNATLVIAGDVEPERALDMARRYFEDVPSGPLVKPLRSPLDDDPERVRVAADCRAARVRLYRAWNVPRLDSVECAALELACEVLTGGGPSRLGRALVEEQGVAGEVGGEFRLRSLGPWIVAWVTAARAGRDTRALEDAFEREMRRFLANGPGADELDTARIRILARFLGGIERVGGPGSKSEALAEAAIIAGEPGFHAERFHRIQSLSREHVVEAARRRLGRPSLTLALRPSDEGGMRAS